MPDDVTAHDIHVLDGLVDAVEESMRALETGADVPPSVRDQALARRSAIDELSAAGARREAGPAGEGLLEKAQRALGRLAADAGDAPLPQAADGGRLQALERREDTLQRRFEAALADRNLSGPARDAVLRAYDDVKPGHDAIRQAALAALGEA